MRASDEDQVGISLDWVQEDVPGVTVAHVVGDGVVGSGDGDGVVGGGDECVGVGEYKRMILLLLIRDGGGGEKVIVGGIGDGGGPPGDEDHDSGVVDGGMLKLMSTLVEYKRMILVSLLTSSSMCDAWVTLTSACT